MATVTVTLPRILDTAPALVEEAALIGMDVAGTEAVTRAQTTAPVDRGFLRNSLRWEKARRVGEVLSGALTTSGQANAYGDVMESGRRPGARRPPVKAIEGWVKRVMPDKVEEIARALLAKRTGKARRGALGKARKQALFLLVRKVIRNMTARGIEGRRFAQAAVGDGTEFRIRIEEQIRLRTAPPGGVA